MTDETREMLNDQERATLEQADARIENAPPEGKEETAEATAESVAEASEPVPEADTTADSGETGVELLDAPAGENLPVATVIDALLGHEEEPDEVDEETPAEQDEARAPTEETPAESAVQEEGSTPTVESVIEAILFATDEPLTESRLAGIVETTTRQVRECVNALNGKYEGNGSAFRIEQIAGGYQMLTLPLYNTWLKKMLRARSDSKLSPAAMETLAIVAYKQPIIRADIEAIRGVAVGEVIRSLMYKGLVKIVGRAEILGRPMLYGTTKKFLEIFGLNSLKDLPKAEDLKNPDRG